MASGGFQWSNPPSKAFNVAMYTERVQRAVKSLGDSLAARIEKDMKDNASWTDRTSNARQALRCRAIRQPDGSTVLVAIQGVEYGKWLEVANGGKYAIVMRTLELYYPVVIRGLRTLLG